MIRDWMHRWAHRSYGDLPWNERPVWAEVVIDESLRRAAELVAEEVAEAA